MSEMTDRVGAAIWAAIEKVAEVEGEPWVGNGRVDGPLPTAAIARAIILAMREPTEAMKRQGADAADGDIGGDWIGKVEVQTTIGQTAWHAMIDEALK